jgi:hypothetical protein
MLAAAARTSSLAERSEMDEGEGLGGKFWLAAIGVCLGVGLAALLLFLLVSAAWYKWGFFGAIIFCGAVLLFWAWIYDRAHTKRYE